MKRRTFMLAATGMLATTGLSVSFLTGCSFPVIPKRPEADFNSALGWIRYDEEGYSLWLPRAEIGQNITTALKQVACEELGIEWDELTVHMPNTADMAPFRATVGSESVKDFALPLAQACATLRDALAQGQTQGLLESRPRPKHELRTFSRTTKWVGQSTPLEQVKEIVTGQPLYVDDVHLPGMIYGRVIHAPAAPDIPSRLLSLNENAARRIPGFIAIVRDARLKLGMSEGVGIVAATPGALDRIAHALEPKWEVNAAVDQSDIDRLVDVDRHLKEGSINHGVRRDSIGKDDSWDINLRFDISMAAHASIEPRAAVANFEPSGTLSVWAGSQDIFYQRDVIAKHLNLDKEQITVHSCRVGGGFGGKTLCMVELEAAVLAEATRRPVKVRWTRSQEFRQGYHRPPSSHRVRVRMRDKQIDEWWHAFASSHIIFTNAVVPPWMQHLTDLIGDNGVARGSQLPYHCSAQRTEFGLARLPIWTGPWRGLGAGPNSLVIESVMDECARRAGKDPVQFRIQHAKDPRLVRVLRLAAAAAPAAVEEGNTNIRLGRGVACGIYKENSYAAVIADVAVTSTGHIRVLRMVCAHDSGMVINPDQVRAQCEGNLVWGVGMVLSDQLTVRESHVSANNFAQAPIPRMADVPTMDIVLIKSDEPPTGAGETAIVASAGAIANAIRHATGSRPTRFPVNPDEFVERNS